MSNTDLKEVLNLLERSRNISLVEEDEHEFYTGLAALYNKPTNEIKEIATSVAADFDAAINIIVNADALPEECNSALISLTNIVNYQWNFLHPESRLHLSRFANNLVFGINGYQEPVLKIDAQFPSRKADKIDYLLYRFTTSVFKFVQKDDIALIIKSNFYKWDLNVIDIIINDRFFLNFLVNASNQVKAYFPSNKLELELISDFEVPDWKYLVIRIYTSLDVDTAFEKLESFKQNWWLEHADAYISQLNITVEFE